MWYTIMILLLAFPTDECPPDSMWTSLASGIPTAYTSPEARYLFINGETYIHIYQGDFRSSAPTLWWVAMFAYLCDAELEACQHYLNPDETISESWTFSYQHDGLTFKVLMANYISTPPEGPLAHAKRVLAAQYD